MVKAELEYKEKGLEKLVEKPLQQTVTYLHIPSFGTQAGINIGGSAGVGGVSSLAFRIPAINEEPIIYGNGKGIYDSYMVWLIKNSDHLGDGYENVLGLILGKDNVIFPGDSPTLKKMTLCLKNMLFGYEVALSFAVYKGLVDGGLALTNYVISIFKRAGEKEYYKEIAKVNGKQALIDFGVAAGVYGGNSMAIA